MTDAATGLYCTGSYRVIRKGTLFACTRDKPLALLLTWGSLCGKPPEESELNLVEDFCGFLETEAVTVIKCAVV